MRQYIFPVAIVLGVSIIASVAYDRFAYDGSIDTAAFLTAESDPVWGAVSNTVTTGAAAGATASQPGHAHAASSVTNGAATWVDVAGDTMSGALLSTRDHLTDAPANDEFPTAAWVRSLAMSGQEWYLTSTVSNFPSRKTSNFVALSADAQSQFTNSIASPVTSTTYLAGGITTNTYTVLRSPITFDVYANRVGGNASTIIPVHCEVYYVYDGTTNHLGDWESANQTVTATTPTRYQFVVAFPEPTITGSVHVLGYLKTGTVSGSAAGLALYGGGVSPSHMDIESSTISAGSGDFMADGSVPMSGNLNFGGQFATNISGITMLAGGNGILDAEYLDITGRGRAIDVYQSYLLDATGTNSVDWANRYLYDSAGALSLGWEEHVLRVSGDGSVDWGNRKLYTTAAGYSLDWDNRYLIDSDGTNSADWGNRQLIGTNGTDVVVSWGTTAAFGGSVTAAVDSIYVNAAGDTMSGDLNLGGNDITNAWVMSAVGQPTQFHDVAAGTAAGTTTVTCVLSPTSTVHVVRIAATNSGTVVKLDFTAPSFKNRVDGMLVISNGNSRTLQYADTWYTATNGNYSTTATPVFGTGGECGVWTEDGYFYRALAVTNRPAGSYTW